ncbi:hypothetical protein [Halobacillus amylolyticus]|uniref:Phospholipid phosphatase n=1 Tax=Halobacillus amylolyticus TaxID=2932259 RepID=A0ABY4HHG5_9BACI|nr:hypothetical protein [Halobacillus amylolyticus]UOR13843.1 hypothetical protein MUO15_10580 [Halobacillus amylolyticus]
MDTVLFTFLTIAYTILLVLAIKVLRNYKVLSTLLLLPVIVGLIYENGIISTGRFIGKGPLLEGLNLARFWIHAFFTPLLVLYAWKTLEQAEVQWASKNWVRIFALLLTASLILMELFTVVIGLNIEASIEYGVLSYSSNEPSSGPPIMVLIVSVVLLVSSLIIWRRQEWIWFFIGSLLMIVGSAIQLPVDSGAITNFFELILISSLLGTAYFQRKVHKPIKGG